MNTIFYMVRHAIKERNRGDVSITAEGVEQADLTARLFMDIPISRIFCSPLNRAKQTADMIGQALQLPIVEDFRLRERANWGDLPDQTFDQFVEIWDRCTKERDFSPPFGDSASQAGDRLSSCLKELSCQYSQECMVIVTHGGLITDFLINEFPEEALNGIHPNFINEQSHLISECSITKINCTSEGFRLIYFAETAHLRK
ncbi:histidine phosphatase family protein [Paenibacillus sp. 5J-6]|uniref:Histidine phosphatase family protein n=2 Tax=Paenibacillus silvestris TaxID=2606219 RepID=A0A6L8VAT7_9BACL|nr:histidine phosphatase family protein [Paenibacillus silvestris]